MVLTILNHHLIQLQLFIKDNLVKTCGGCHPGANNNFTIGKIHITRQDESEPIIYFIASAYIALIFSVIGLMFVHNLLDFFRKSKIKKMKQRGLIREERHGHSLYLRMTLNERIQHATLAVSFLTLGNYRFYAQLSQCLVGFTYS